MRTHNRIFITVAACLHMQAFAETSREIGCNSAPTTQDLMACREKQLQAANIQLKTYLDAAELQATKSNLSVEKLKFEQENWDRYRENHCDNVYLLWVQGTVRYDMAAQCNLRLIRERTYDLWAAYLTYIDSTPSILPDPTK